uniref:Ycf1 n=1 Tax=Romanomermis culicivorax TaxID=13658 RepID=A0A915KKS0_ROMCU
QNLKRFRAEKQDDAKNSNLSIFDYSSSNVEYGENFIRRDLRINKQNRHKFKKVIKNDHISGKFLPISIVQQNFPEI